MMPSESQFNPTRRNPSKNLTQSLSIKVGICNMEGVHQQGSKNPRQPQVELSPNQHMLSVSALLQVADLVTLSQISGAMKRGDRPIKFGTQLCIFHPDQPNAPAQRCKMR